MTAAELILELQDAVDQDAEVFFTPWQRRTTTRGKVRRVVICDGGIYLIAAQSGHADYVPNADVSDIELYEGSR